MRIAVLILCLFASLASFAQKPVQYLQSKDTLIQKRKEIMEAIAETERQLEAIKSDKKATMGQLRALQNKLADRQRLIGNINTEISGLDRAIRHSSSEVQTLKQKLEDLKMKYAQSIRYAYSTRSSYDMLAFIFSSRDFNDALRRMKYLKKYREFRIDQVTKIHQTQDELQKKIGTLAQEKTEKDKLLNTQVQQKQVLQNEKDQTNRVVQDLRSKENNLMANIEKNKKITARINKAINDLIEREMAKAAAAAKKEAAKTGGSKIKVSSGKEEGPGVAVNTLPKSEATHEHADVELLMTPEDVELADNFEGNRGKMYWPVERGYITDHFGKHPHPLAPNVIIEQAGIDIQTDAHTNVRCVFSGTVTNVFSVAGEGTYCVMVKHGNYFTVYRGLASTTVSKDQEIDTKQVIGKVGENYEGQPVVNFQIWKAGKSGNIKLNPESWIGKAH